MKQVERVTSAIEPSSAIDLSGADAKKAARVFDSFDTNGTGFVRSLQFEDLLDELGEGLYGDELAEQLALIDRDNSGRLQRSSFVTSYVNFVAGSDSDASSLDSDEKAERDEEREKARKSFEKLATKDEKGTLFPLSEGLSSIV